MSDTGKVDNRGVYFSAVERAFSCQGAAVFNDDCNQSDKLTAPLQVVYYSRSRVGAAPFDIT